jgi:hypothetical protein
MSFQLVALTGHPDFLDLPWEQPLAEWESDRLVEVRRGIHRHVVRFVSYDARLYALKEIPAPIAQREYRLLRELAENLIPAVEAVGVVTERAGRQETSHNAELDAVLITRYLDYSLPYRIIFTSLGIPTLQNTLLDALAELLVRLHLIGFFWGDCSLSNTLFRRDAGALTAYLVDAETSEKHPSLSDGMRHYDIEIAAENIAGELMDLQAGIGLPPEIEPIGTAREIRVRYDNLWSELTQEEIFAPNERYRIDTRLRRLNDLGFDVKEVELVRSGDGDRVRLQTQCVEVGHHRRLLRMLTGLDVQENQARRLLNDIASYRAALEHGIGIEVSEAVAAFRWLREIFEPTIESIPGDLREKLEPAEIFHQILEHRWFLSEKAGEDVGLAEAVPSYIEHVLPFTPNERTLLTLPDPEDLDTGA